MGNGWGKTFFGFMACFCAVGVIGCLPFKTLTVANVGMILEDVGKASAKQTDLSILREGTPSYLMLADGLIEAVPKNKRLLLAAAEAYRASAFMYQDDPDMAGRLFLKGKEYAMRAMPRPQEFRLILSQPYQALEQYVQRFSRKNVPVLFSFTSCWAGWISVSMDSVKALADLSRVVLLMDRIINLDETYYYGGAHLFMGIYKSARPKAFGGEPEEARRHFERAIEIGKGDFLMTYVYYAENYATKTFQRDLFLSLLRTVLETPPDRVPELTLINTLAKTRAQELIDDVEDYF